jgi:hypothetical protein
MCLTGWLVVAIAAAAIAAFALFEIGRSFPHHQIRNEAHPRGNQAESHPEISHEQSQPTDERPDIKEDKWNKVVAYSTVVMAIFTGALFLATWALWNSGERHSEKALRAYVGVDAGEIQNFGIEKPIKSVLRLKNSGQTPAYNLVTRQYMKIGTFPISDFTSDVKERRTNSFLSPVQDVFANVSGDRTLTDKEHKAVIDGESVIYVVFELSYRDVFQKERTMNYRAYFRGNKTDPGSTLELSQTEDGNKAD